MAIIDPSSNGKQKDIEVPTEIVVTITLKESAGGLALNVQHDPHVFPDTVIEMCHRIARIYQQETRPAPLEESGTGEAGVIVLVLTARFTPVGLDIVVGHDPDLLPDTVIDACLRTARFYERQLLLMDLATAQRQAMKQVRSVQTLGDMFPKRPRG